MATDDVKKARKNITASGTTGDRGKVRAPYVVTAGAQQTFTDYIMSFYENLPPLKPKEFHPYTNGIHSAVHTKMIATAQKLGRMASGDTFFDDNIRDIGGYAICMLTVHANCSFYKAGIDVRLTESEVRTLIDYDEMMIRKDAVGDDYRSLRQEVREHALDFIKYTKPSSANIDKFCEPGLELVKIFNEWNDEAQKCIKEMGSDAMPDFKIDITDKSGQNNLKSDIGFNRRVLNMVMAIGHFLNQEKYDANILKRIIFESEYLTNHMVLHEALKNYGEIVEFDEKLNPVLKPNAHENIDLVRNFWDENIATIDAVTAGRAVRLIAEAPYLQQMAEAIYRDDLLSFAPNTLEYSEDGKLRIKESGVDDMERDTLAGFITTPFFERDLKNRRIDRPDDVNECFRIIFKRDDDNGFRPTL